MRNHANDNAPRDAASFTSLEERRAWLENAPATHAANHTQSPCVIWAKREKDETTFFGLKLWRTLNEPPRMAANDNEAQDEDVAEAGAQPVLPSLDRELIDVSARQLIYAEENDMVRWQGNRLSKVWNGRKWVSPDARFGAVRKRKVEKADTEHFDVKLPDVQEELARALDVERLRARLGYKVTTILDMASSDNTLAEIGEYLGGQGQYATRIASKEVRAAVVALNAALAASEEAA
jgi:hypothetical protein